jgi:hypothetical protein
MATRIDHTGHPHPSTPKARALCRANGGTGSTAKTGTQAPASTRSLTTATVSSGPVAVVAKAAAPKSIVGPGATALPPRKTTTPKKVDPPPAPPTNAAVPPRNLSATMKTHIPEFYPSDMDRTERKIAGALRNGASREFIIAQSGLSSTVANQAIDEILIRFGVPNHVYPRSGIGRRSTPPPPPAPKPRAKKTSTGGGVVAGGAGQTSLDKLKATGRVEAPTGPETPNLRALKRRITLADKRVQAKAERVAAIQERVVGAAVTRIKSMKTGIPTGASYKGMQNANGTCLNGHIHLHQSLEGRKSTEAAGRISGFKVRGGDDPIETTIAHEMGHALLTNWDITSPQRGDIAKAMIEAMDLQSTGQNWYSFEALESLVKNNKAKISKAIKSKYATTNANEFIAEVWADYTMNPNPSDTIRKIGDAIKNVVAQLPAR